jgi:two-component system, OmpR family, alkaline phosphatase synthesis response regulator PhoP
MLVKSAALIVPPASRPWSRTMPSAAAKNDPAPSRLPRILVADDDPQGIELLEAYLSDSNFEIRTTADGDQTLEEVRQWQPDVILLDIMMPKISGFEVCKRLRANPATRGTGVLMVTALDQPSDRDRAVEAGADDFLTKPINKAELLLRVQALLKSRSSTSDLERALAYFDAVESRNQ